ncbi:MAG: hypothetical protein DSY42_03005 [Aquifex sp.]|nr:MAG: hypothetical protein DSY42_03005 [Aquifex sp.]
MEDATFEWSESEIVNTLKQKGYDERLVIEYLTENKEKLLSVYNSVPEPDEEKTKEIFEVLKDSESLEELLEEAKVRLIEEGYRFTSRVKNFLEVLYGERKRLSPVEVLSLYFERNYSSEDVFNPDRFLEFAREIGYEVKNEKKVRELFDLLEGKIVRMINDAKDLEDFLSEFDEWIKRAGSLKELTPGGKEGLKKASERLWRRIREGRDELDEALEEVIEKLDVFFEKLKSAEEERKRELLRKLWEFIVSREGEMLEIVKRFDVEGESFSLE